MTVTEIKEPRRRGYLIDPHDGTCSGVHNIAVCQLRNHEHGFWFPATYTWGIGTILSLVGTMEFMAAMHTALQLGIKLDSRDDVRPS